MYVLACLLLLLVTNASASNERTDHTWYRTFVLEDNIVVTHTPTNLLFQAGEQSKEMGSYSFRRRSHNLFGTYPLEDGKIETKMSLEDFRTEVAKLGNILKEDEFNHWTKTFHLANGLEVTHSPKLLTFARDGKTLEMSQFHFDSGAGLFETLSNGKGILSTEMSIDAFREQLCKMSPVIVEK